MAFWGKGLPHGVNKATAVVVLVLNAVVPGLGTVVAAYAGRSEGNDTVVTGVLQFVTSFIVLGYVWAVVWGVLLVRRASSAATAQENVPQPMQQGTESEPLNV